MQGGRRQISGDESTNAPDKEHNKAVAQVGELQGSAGGRPCMGVNTLVAIRRQCTSRPLRMGGKKEAAF